MRKLLFTISIILILSLSWITFGANTARVNAQITDNDLIAEWKFNEGSGDSVLDTSGRNYNGITHGCSWIANQEDYALSFNGVSDYVDIPSLPVSNIEALAVVAWINSDLAKTGYIFYHGDTGEFLLHNGERMSDGPVAGRYPNLASFSVKLAGSTWHDVYSQSLEPNVWHQIVGVWVKGTSLKIYVDGALAGENNDIASGYLLNDGSNWLPSLGVYNRGAEANTYYKGLLDNVMVFNRALTSQEIVQLYNSNNPQPLPKPTLNLSCKSSTLFSGFKVEINGNLAINSTTLADEPILLSYSVNNGKSWQDLTLTYTSSDGSYLAEWRPSVTGNYKIKATFEGNNEYSNVSQIMDLAVTPYKEENTFSVASNSTLSELAFNSASNQLTFTIEGESGTTGYVNVYLPKTLINDISALKVYLDEKQIEYSTNPQNDSWLLSFTYQHSAHNIAITLNSALNPANDLNGNLMCYGVIIAAIAIIIALALIVRQRKVNS
jgi:hypothetical protein